ncbi:MAG TPA: glycoside hydrolase family 16 protein [Kiritimatiellia bacterium]|nr:glycoside hydrolase family 16 protein [Kiritimatiellia bacterium]HPS07673.1 glycoside hydrolase family 16 protein [Kiritimatiellia bacterium]
MKRRQRNTVALGAGILLAVMAAGCKLADLNSAGQSAKSNVPAGYEKVWGDEFDGASLDARNWTLRRDMGPTADLSLAGAERPDVLSVTDGQLRLNAIRNGGEPPYTTCLSVTTCDKMHFQYGYLEMRAKVPYGQGAWPSFWMKAMPGKISPPRFKDYMVEVDIFEVFSNPDTAVPNLHKWYGGKKHTQSGCPRRYTFTDAANLRGEYHTYGFEWTPQEMSMYVDGEKYCTYDLSADFDRGGSMQGFHDPLYIIFNNHIFTGHSPWKPKGSEVDERSVFPMQYWIDWIRLYQKPGVGKLYTEEHPAR